MKNKSNKQAFTLAEVLVTLGIIGVVAAMTIPTVMTNYQKEAQVVQFRKITTEFASAADMYITENAKTSLAGTGIFNDGGVQTFMASKFKTSACNSCFAPSYSPISGASQNFTCDGNSYLLANSAAVCIKVQDAENRIIKIEVDTNGVNPPNKGGRDMFSFTLLNNGNIGDVTDGAYAENYRQDYCQEQLEECNDPSSDACQLRYSDCMEDDSNLPSPNNLCTTSSTGIGCYGKLVNSNWKMNY